VEGSDALFIVAELAIAFAGFASLATVIGRRHGGDRPEIDALRLRNMLEASLLVAALALFPLLPFYANVSSEGVWRSSSSLLGVIVPFLGLLHMRRLGSFREVHRPSVLYLVVQGLLLGSATVGLWCNAFGFLPDFQQGAYFWGLFALLIYSGILFVRLVQSLLDHASPS
jgi:hypothetical protein